MTLYFARAIGLVAGVVVPILAGAEPITFTPIATTSTPVPNGVGNFSSFKVQAPSSLVPPSLDGASVSFAGLDQAARGGVYRYDSGMVSMVANTSTSIPRSTATFDLLGFSVISGPSVAFRASGGAGTSAASGGIYLASAGFISPVADNNMLVPGTNSGVFDGYGDMSIDNTDVSFFGQYHINSVTHDGIYRYRNHSLSIIANENTAIPDGTGTFQSLNTNVNGANGYIAFWGKNQITGPGIYMADPSDNISVIANSNTTDPVGGGLLVGFSNISLSANDTAAAFIGTNAAGATSLFKRVDGVLHVVARTGQLAPGGGILRITDLELSLDDSHVAFLASVDPGLALFTDRRGELERVIGRGDLIGDKVIRDLVIGPDALSGTSIAFAAQFTDGTSGVFVANVPEPWLFNAGAIGLLLLLRRYRTYLDPL